jgi:hypothetical protein
MPKQRRTFKLEPTDLRAAPARRYAAGRARREAVPLEAHAEVAAGARRADPLAILVKQEKTRLSEFIPLRYGRMSRTPFTFLRGSAAIMASDLAAGARTDLEVELCGDAHLGNFRWYHAPTRELVFDLNDFDETLPGPFEWDVKRLAASITVAGRASGFTNEQARRATRSAMRDYRKSIAETSARNPLDLHYYRFESRGALERIGTHGKSHRKWKEAVLAEAARRAQRCATTASPLPRLRYAIHSTCTITASSREGRWSASGHTARVIGSGRKRCWPMPRDGTVCLRSRS